MKGSQIPWMYFAQHFSIDISIQWKFCFALICILLKWSSPDFALKTTAMLIFVHIFVAAELHGTQTQQEQLSILFELNIKISELSHIYDKLTKAMLQNRRAIYASASK